MPLAPKQVALLPASLPLWGTLSSPPVGASWENWVRMLSRMDYQMKKKKYRKKNSDETC